MEPSLPSQPYQLMDLPDELKLHIVNYIERRRDLYNLSRTCRVFEDMTMRRLYYDVDLEVSSQVCNKAGTSPLRTPLIQSVRQLTIRNGIADKRRTSVYARRRKSNDTTLESYMKDVLDHIPPNQLTSFAFLHANPLSAPMLDTVTRKHNLTLRHLTFYESDSSQLHAALPTNLRSLEVRTINDGEIIPMFLRANEKTLERLRLGQEKHIVDGYRRNRVGYFDLLPQPSETFFRSAYNLEAFPRLRDLSLSGLDLSTLRPSSSSHALVFCRLERLCLESCPGSAELLESLAAAFHWSATSSQVSQPRQKPSLKHFYFRCENPTNALKDSIVRFLCSFTGLQTLSLLFENATLLERCSTLLADHGSTMRTLVLESRIQPREHLGLDTSRPFGVGGYSQQLWEESINDIARLCPNLVELGMGFPWNDEIVRLRKTLLPTLKHLRTIHVRNFPENQVFSQLGDYTIKEYATKFIEWVFPALVGGSKPTLEHFAMGPTLYETRLKMLPSSDSTRGGTLRSQPPEFLRTHHFALDWAKTRFGRWSPMITPVTERWAEEVEERRPLGGVFEQVWLK